MVDRHLIVAVVGTPLLLLALGAVVRTEAVIGDLVRAAIETRARAAGADVEVHTLSPAGLWGIELEGVSARIPRGGFAVEADLQSVRIQPKLLSLLSGELVVDEVELGRGTIGLRPWKEAPRTKGDTHGGVSPQQQDTHGGVSPQPNGARGGVSPLQDKRRGVSPKPAPTFDVALVDVDVVAYSERYRSRPVHLARLELEVSARAGVTASIGYGTLPDGVAFRVADPRDGRIVIAPQTRTRIDRWAAPLPGGEGWPIGISATRLEVCATRGGCEALLFMQDVELTAPVWRDDVRVTAPYATVARQGRALVLDAPEMSIVDPTTSEFAARLTEIDVRYTLDGGELSGAVELADRDGGTLGVDWTFDAEDFDVAFAAASFDAASVWHLVPYGEKLRPGRVDGTLRTRYDLRHLTIDAQADLRFDRLSAWFPVTRESFDFSRLHVQADAYADLGGRAFSLQSFRLRLGEAAPFEARAELVHARKGWSFDGELNLPRQEVRALLAELPPQLAGVTDGALISGEIGFTLAARGHTAFPDSLMLKGAMDADVVVERDAPATDPHALGTRGAPPQLDQASWVDYRRFPREAVDAVLAAEDAQFWNHDGFDWGGLERAMKYNLGHRRLVRGGSTVSQQVAKNLWLSGERTIARKLEEAYLTWRLEEVHDKRRIVEIYLNLADWGPGTRGIWAAAHRYFDAEPTDLAPVEVALLAAILPNPARFGGWVRAGKLSSSRLEKVEHTLSNLRFMKKITPAQYDAAWSAARDHGRIGRLALSLCSDEGGTPSC